MKPLLYSFSRVRTDADVYASRYLIAIAVTLASVLELLDTSIVNVAIPEMMGTLGATLEEITWVSTGYVVANVIILPVSGWLSGFVGRRNYFVISILVFTLSSVACGNATTLGGLVFWRIIQGLAGGGLISTAQAALFESFPPKEAHTAMAIFGLGVMVGPMLGPTLGGWITDNWSWPWIFYINLPMGAFALLLALMYVPDSKHDKRADTIDGVGFMLLVIGIGCLQTMLERGEKLDWLDSREIVAYAIVSVLALVLFVRQELRHEHPIIDLRILHDVQFTASISFGFLLGAALYSSVFVLPVYLQTILNFTAWDTGLVLLPAAVGSGFTMAVLGRSLPRLPRADLRLFVIAGALIYGYSMWRHSLFTTQSGLSDFLFPVTLRGVGLAMIFLPLNSLCLGSLPPQQLAAGSGLYNLTRQLGGSVGIAFSATLLTQLEKSNRGELLLHVNQFSADALERLARLKGLFISRGVPEVLAQAKGLLLLNGMVSQQAAMLAFERMFLLFGMALLSALPLLFLMRRCRAMPPTSAAH